MSGHLARSVNVGCFFILGSKNIYIKKWGLIGGIMVF